jgi:hypothetical protein
MRYNKEQAIDDWNKRAPQAADNIPNNADASKESQK